MSAIRVFRHGLALGVHDFNVFWSSRTIWLFTWILRVTTSAAMWVLLGRLLGSNERLYFLLIGQAVMVGPQSAGWTVAASTWDRHAGTYPLLVIAPSSLVPAMMGRTSIWLLNGIATSVTTFAVLLLVFGVSVPFPQILLVPVLVAIVCASFYALSLVLGCLVMRAPALRNVLHNVASILTMTTCGVVVPVSFWPEWVQNTVGLLPVTHGLYAVRVLLDEGPALDIVIGAGLEMLVGGIWLGLAIVMMDYMAHAGRRDGSIQLVSCGLGCRSHDCR